MEQVNRKGCLLEVLTSFLLYLSLLFTGTRIILYPHWPVLFTVNTLESFPCQGLSFSSLMPVNNGDGLL